MDSSFHFLDANASGPSTLHSSGTCRGGLATINGNPTQFWPNSHAVSRIRQRLAPGTGTDHQRTSARIPPMTHKNARLPDITSHIELIDRFLDGSIAAPEFQLSFL